MKSLFVFAIAVLSARTLAQEQTLFDVTDVEHGGYGAMVIRISSFNDEFGVMMGGRGGWIVDHSFAIGFAGYGLANNVHSRVTGPAGERFVNFGYGGLDLEIILNSDDLIHLSLNSLIGGGAVGFRGGMNDIDMDNRMNDTFFVLEPGVNLDVNVTRWFRASFGMSYRHISGVTSEASGNSDLRGTSASMMFRFGKF